MCQMRGIENKFYEGWRTRDPCGLVWSESVHGRREAHAMHRMLVWRLKWRKSRTERRGGIKHVGCSEEGCGASRTTRPADNSEEQRGENLERPKVNSRGSWEPDQSSVAEQENVSVTRSAKVSFRKVEPQDRFMRETSVCTLTCSLPIFRSCPCSLLYHNTSSHGMRLINSVAWL